MIILGLLLEILYAIFIAFVFLSAYKSIVKLFDRQFRKKINKTKNTQDANNLRKKLLNRRKKISVIYFTLVFLYVLTVIIVALIDGKIRLSINGTIIITVLLVTIFLEYKKTDLYGNISYQTPKEFLANNKDFYLYLRGFDVDIPFGEETNNDNTFNESMFVEVVDYALGIVCCALGMTKEVDSPIGATRVYVDDNDWKERVLELMQKAKKIFILVNSRESCIWEIEQSVYLLNKTVFIVDDYQKYNYIKNRFMNDINLPVNTDASSVPFCFESGKEPVSYNNNWKGYFKIIGLDADVFEDKMLEKRKEQLLEHPMKF